MATYRRPGQVAQRWLDMGAREDRALAVLMAGCTLVFISQWPVLNRRAVLEDVELSPLLGASLMAWIFIAPLLFYAISFVIGLVLRAMGKEEPGYPARITLFWPLLATSPIILLYGLTVGFTGDSPAATAVGLIWCVLFLWFWISGLRRVLKA
ncbi:YIP1 family protein [Pseudaestuariivita sp.]|uniref:YIP1 family protein n=1 Tax=Pseudaestuariivita sp. TaxID=2211669 RepID=UPI00405870E8